MAPHIFLLRARDVKTLADYYTEMFELEPRAEARSVGDYVVGETWVPLASQPEFRNGFDIVAEGLAGLPETDLPSPRRNAIFWALHNNHLEELVARLEAAGHPMRSDMLDMFWGQAHYIQDPEGNDMEIMRASTPNPLSERTRLAGCLSYRTHDVPRLNAFYTKVLGYTHTGLSNEYPFSYPDHWAELTIPDGIDDIRYEAELFDDPIHNHPATEPSRPSRNAIIPVHETTRFDDWLSRFAENEVTLTSDVFDIGFGRSVYFQDVDGNDILLRERT